MKITPITKYKIKGQSMYPTFREDQDIISYNWAYLGRKPEVGDVVIIKVDGKEMIKRIQKKTQLKVFVTGDNINGSTDSRHFGSINLDQVVGKVVY